MSTKSSSELAREIEEFLGVAHEPPRQRAIALLREARAALLAMGERLEVDFAWDARGRKVPFPAGAPDGIDCRDETIKLLEANNERLHRTIEAAWSTLGGREQHWVEHLDRDGTPRRDQLTLPGALLFLMQRIEDLESK